MLSAHALGRDEQRRFTAARLHTGRLNDAMAGGPHQLLLYDYVTDILERREPHREGHLALARQWKEDGPLVMAGPLGDPPHGAAFVFQVDDPSAVEPFVEADPYVAAGLVSRWRIEPWKVL